MAVVTTLKCGPVFDATPITTNSPQIAGSAWLHSNAALRDAIRRLHPQLLEGLSKQDRDSVLRASTYRKFKRDSVAVNQGDPADRLFLLINGSARFFFITPGGRKVYLLWLGPGEVFGGASLLTQPAQFVVSTEVAEDTDALVWQRNTIRDLAMLHPRLLENALSTACDYLVWYVATHVGLVCHSARRRLAHVLVSLASGFGQKVSNGIKLEITNEQLANTANVTLFTASRLLSEWHRTGALVKGRGKILLRHPDQLFHNPSRENAYQEADNSVSIKKR